VVGDAGGTLHDPKYSADRNAAPRTSERRVVAAPMQLFRAGMRM
jgi:hypothetical protein